MRHVGGRPSDRHRSGARDVPAGFASVGVPGRGQAVHRFRQRVGAGAEVDADELSAAPCRVQSAAGQHRDAVAECRLREGVAVTVGEAHPQGVTAGDSGDLPLRQPSRQLSAQEVMAGPAVRRRVLTQGLQLGQQFGGGESGGEVPAEVVYRSEPGEPVDDGPLGRVSRPTRSPPRRSC